MRKSLINILVFLALVTCGLGEEGQGAEQYPVKPINFIVPLEPGSDGDIMCRPLCQKLSALLGQPVVVINKPGAGSSIGFREIHDTKPDGYTVGQGFAALITNKLQGLLPYDFEDFTIMGSFFRLNHIIVGATKTQRPFKTIQEAFSFAKSHPGEVSIATGSVGQSLWIATMALAEGTGLKFNIIPQVGAGGFTIAQVAGGHTDLAAVNYPAAKAQIEAGNVRFLATFGSKRFPPPLDNAPTLKEVGYDVVLESVGGMIGPPKMPKDITDKLVKAFEIAANDPEFKKFLSQRSIEPIYLTPDQTIDYFTQQRVLFRKIMDKAGILKEK
jgi:tripartite-type tricarboxylate transporter receptor subunit TctC